MPQDVCPECNETRKYGHKTDCSRFLDHCERMALWGRVENLQAIADQHFKLIQIALRKKPWWKFW